MAGRLEKVTAFITRKGEYGTELLLLQHPTAGMQLVGGTVEEGETPVQAVLREVHEETGLSQAEVVAPIGREEQGLGDDHFLVASSTKVYSRPDLTSFDWAVFRRGIGVKMLRQHDEFLQVSYTEYDDLRAPHYVTYNITGWVPKQCLASIASRHFFHIECNEERPESWKVYSDNHEFTLVWFLVSDVPQLVSPHARWFKFVTQELKYRFYECNR